MVDHAHMVFSLYLKLLKNKEFSVHNVPFLPHTLEMALSVLLKIQKKNSNTSKYKTRDLNNPPEESLNESFT